MRKNSVKNTRVSEEVRREMSKIIDQKLKDPRIHPMTTVVDCEVTPDLKFCKVYISVLGDESAKEETLAGLKSSAGFARRELARTVNLRNTPEITFVLDTSIEYGVNMSKRLDEIAKKDGTYEDADEEMLDMSEADFSDDDEEDDEE
ncbi:MAG: 30S ribosome-binding factor RbfA [Lachnospiraceae bacterium]|nr:30S ribosome-binding factor RbfA [Lachnospiraceae bacterium]